MPRGVIVIAFDDTDSHNRDLQMFKKPQWSYGFEAKNKSEGKKRKQGGNNHAHKYSAES